MASARPGRCLFPRTLLDDLQRALTPPEAEAEERLALEALARFLS